MFQYLIRRFLVIIPTLVAVSIISFIVIQLPPGDYLTFYVAHLQDETGTFDQALLQKLQERYGINQPAYVQYFKWISNIILHNDWGDSMYYKMPVRQVIGDRVVLTMVLSFFTLIFGWLVAIPIGVFSATHQYSFGDYVITGLNFIGRGVPQFMLALLVMWFAMTKLGMSIGGLFSPEYITAPWTWVKFVDMLKHIWQPMLILAVGSTASDIRITRANLLDELSKPYVETARAKGLPESRLVWKYPARVALSPFFSTVGWSLAHLISGSTIVSIVLGLQTTGPVLYTALITQDMYLAGSFILLLSALTVLGTLLSDILLAVADPRIRLG